MHSSLTALFTPAEWEQAAWARQAEPKPEFEPQPSSGWAVAPRKVQWHRRASVSPSEKRDRLCPPSIEAQEQEYSSLPAD